MQAILLKGEVPDFEFMIGVLRSYVNLSDYAAMRRALHEYEKSRSLEAKRSLTELLEREIRYAGSSDVAYAVRWLQRREPGISADELVHDVAKRLKVKIPRIGPIEAKLKVLTEAVTVRELFKLSPEEQRELIQSQGLGLDPTKELLLHLKRHAPVAIFPTLLSALGTEAVEAIVMRLMIRYVGQIIGREAARQLVANLALRFPWWAQWVGPVAWGLTGAWVALDVQGPAYRKTVPILLYLSLLELRDPEVSKRSSRPNVIPLAQKRTDGV